MKLTVTTTEDMRPTQYCLLPILERRLLETCMFHPFAYGHFFAKDALNGLVDRMLSLTTHCRRDGLLVTNSTKQAIQSLVMKAPERDTRCLRQTLKGNKYIFKKLRTEEAHKDKSLPDMWQSVPSSTSTDSLNRKAGKCLKLQEVINVLYKYDCHWKLMLFYNSQSKTHELPYDNYPAQNQKCISLKWACQLQQYSFNYR